MAISYSAVWEVRSAGNDANGGMYDASISGAGTDYSQQDSAQMSVTDAVTTSTTTVTSATGGFTSAMIGNGINIAGTVYVITARASTNSITVDRTTGTGTGQTAKVGGAFATPSKAFGVGVTSNKYWIKGSATYSQSVDPTFNAVGLLAQNSVPPNYITGYVTTRGDATAANKASWPILQLAAASTTVLPIGTSHGWRIEYLTLDCNSIAGSTGLNITPGYGCEISYLLVKNFKLYGLNIGTGVATIHHIEVTGGIAGATAGITTQLQVPQRNLFVHDNACVGIALAGNAIVTDSIIVNNTGVASDGVQCTFAAEISNCTIVGNGRDGISQSSQYLFAYWIRFNIIALNGRYGMNFTQTGFPNDSGIDGNYYGSGGQANTSGQRNGCSTGVLDVSFTVDPFTNTASNDWSLNNTASGGAVIRGGANTTFLGGTTTSYLDAGAVQHADPVIKIPLGRKRRSY